MSSPCAPMPNEFELVDDANGVVMRRLVVGDLDTNCWVVHGVSSRRAVLIDPGDNAAGIVAATSDLTIEAIVLTHAHFDHVLGLAELVDACGAPVYAHPDDAPVWPHEQQYLMQHGHFDAGTATDDLLACGCLQAPPVGAPVWDGRSVALHHGDHVRAGDLSFTVLHTPGHTPGGLTLSTPGHLITGDTLFPGGAGLTGWPLSDFDTVMTSVEHTLMAFPDKTIVHPGHGRDTTIGHERPHLADWRARGW
jgi:hydroxyacylglutathione hydrolase